MSPNPPFICGTLLTAMIAAGVSHYWSVETFVADYPTVPAVRLSPASPTHSKEKELETPPVPLSEESSGDLLAQREFFSSLMSELRTLKNENRDLRDSMGETNRDVMKLAFRVDSHSESFRPLPTSEEREDTSYGSIEDEFPGVLPPKASPVYPLDE